MKTYQLHFLVLKLFQYPMYFGTITCKEVFLKQKRSKREKWKFHILHV